MSDYGIPDDLFQGGSHLAPNSGSPSLASILRGTKGTIADPVATVTALGAVSANNRSANQVRMVTADGSLWRFHATSTLAAVAGLVVVPDSGTGRWLRMPGVVDLSMAFTFSTADAATLLTVPAGALLLVRRGYWEIASDMTGGSSSAIGLSSSNASFNTKGDLLGGASGDVAATLVAGTKLGTIGAKTATGILLVGANTVRFDRITSAFTAGSGNAHLVCDLLANPGA